MSASLPAAPGTCPYIYQALTEAVVSERFAHFLEHTGPGNVERFLLPGCQRTINFLLHNVLGGGGIASIRNDARARATPSCCCPVPSRYRPLLRRHFMTVFNSRVNPNSDSFTKTARRCWPTSLTCSGSMRAGDDLGKNAKPLCGARPADTAGAPGRLLDPGMPLLAIGNIAGYLLDNPDPEKSIPFSTIIAAIGFISGVRCVVVVDDSGIQAGS